MCSLTLLILTWSQIPLLFHSHSSRISGFQIRCRNSKCDCFMSSAPVSGSLRLSRGKTVEQDMIKTFQCSVNYSRRLWITKEMLSLEWRELVSQLMSFHKAPNPPQQAIHAPLAQPSARSYHPCP